MAESKVARLLQQIDLEYQAAKWGFTGLAYGASKHQFITTKMENMGKALTTLTDVVGSAEEAGKLVAQTLEHLPDTPTRDTLTDFLRRELKNTEEITILIEQIETMWETRDRLIARFGSEDARKIIETPSSLISEKEEGPHE